MDWTADPELPRRFKTWKKQVQDEVRLFMAEDPEKKKTYACTYILVCAGEHGEDLLRKAKLDGEQEDYKKMLKGLEDSITPPSNNLEDSIQYFFLKQGDLSVSQYQAEAERLIQKIIPNYKVGDKLTHEQVKEILLRNLLLVGLRHRDVFKECQKLPKEDCTSAKILDIAYQAEYRESTNKRIAKTVNTSNLKSALEEVSEEVQIKKLTRKPTPNTTAKPKPKKKTCRWCGGPQWCKRSECPAKRCDMLQM